MHDVVVRSETPEDIRAIDVVNVSAFAGDVEANLVSSLRGSTHFISDLSLVAEINGRIVGHILLSRILLAHDDGSREILALGPMSVVPSQSQRGIGSVLVKAAIERARKGGHVAIIEAGYPDYYQRFGFKPIANWSLTSNLQLPKDAVTALELEDGVFQSGDRIVYPDLFAALF
ncbi:MAG: N-acetyltransferase [Gammaproteobacteria bacterium]|nr:N-acetyltransferase [Gammaproteobacteria bacterium]